MIAILILGNEIPQFTEKSTTGKYLIVNHSGETFQKHSQYRKGEKEYGIGDGGNRGNQDDYGTQGKRRDETAPAGSGIYSGRESVCGRGELQRSDFENQGCEDCAEPGIGHKD
jgi:hypothetical protein